MTDLSKVEEILNYSFKNKKLLYKAFTHSSYANQHGLENNERMEFLGDAVLQMIVTDYIYDNCPQDEGFMSRVRANTVSSDSLSQVTLLLNLDDYLLLGETVINNKDNLHNKIWANLYESVLCAIYQDGGYAEAKKFVFAHLQDQIDNAIRGNFYDNAKTELQEYCQKRKIEVIYKQRRREGPDHNPLFIYSVLLDGHELAQGKGYSKIAAQTQAAQIALETLRGTK